MSELSFDKDDIEWIGGYAKEVNDVFGSEFEANRDRFREGQLLLDRFGASIQTLLDNGRGIFAALTKPITNAVSPAPFLTVHPLQSVSSNTNPVSQAA